MSLAPGAKLAHFEIVEPIGAGGMGEVYKAHDRKLDRDVAIKVLPEELSRDPERLTRFAREAKLLASLNHPNIAHVYGFESSMLPDGSTAHFLAMELVPGEDLAERLARGPIPVDEALAIAKQIADALEEAHEKGIVHRDLKPANVKLTPDGKVKVLDFGLAKAYTGDGLLASGSDLSQSPTLAHTGTHAGVILGTAGYMSPEQARGKAVDKRADVWSFGVVLFEMLTGKRLFDGETVSDVLAAVLTKEPDWSALPSTTPAGSVRLLRRCLERDPRQRLRDIGEARIALETTNLAEPVSVAAPARRYRGLATGMAALALTATAFVAGLWLRPSPRVTRKLDITDAQMKSDYAVAPVLSPNGERVLYFSQEGLRVRELNQAEARTIVDSDGITNPFWSPDGREIGFFKDDALYRVTLDGGAPLLIAQTAGPAVNGAGASWSADGRIVYALGNSALFEVSARGGEPRALLWSPTEPKARIIFTLARSCLAAARSSRSFTCSTPRPMRSPSSRAVVAVYF